MMNSNIDEALKVSANLLSLTLDHPKFRKYGWNRKSAGSPANDQMGSRLWIKVFGKRINSPTANLWDGELAASRIFPNVHKPRILKYLDWPDDDWIWRSIVMTYVDEGVLSDKPTLLPDAKLDDAWLDSLCNSLHGISTQATDRIAIRQDLVTRRLAEQYGSDINPVIQRWVVGHNDLHYANLTEKTACILDWESWGKVPEGFDAAWLYCHSLTNEIASKKIYERFEPALTSSSGLLSLLFSVAEMRRMNKLYGDYAEVQAELDMVVALSLPRVGFA